MPRQKDLKRAVRTRMKKTGESYTTARAKLLAKRTPEAETALPTRSASVKRDASTAKSNSPPGRSPRAESASASKRSPGTKNELASKRTSSTKRAPAGKSAPAAKRAPKPSECDALAGMSSEAVQAKTGKTWREWVTALDAVGATEMTHRDIARHVGDNYDVSGWWAQSITVGYERIRGLRDVGQRRGGSYDANKSKTFPVPIGRLYKAFSVKRTRERWLENAAPTIRTSQVNRSMRMTWPDGTTVSAWFTDKGPAKSQVAIQHGGLEDKQDVARRKEYWARRFAALGRILRD